MTTTAKRLSDEEDYARLSRKELLHLWSLSQQCARDQIERYAQHSNIMIGAAIAILGAGGAAFFVGYSPSVLCIPVFDPLFLTVPRK